MVFVTNRPNTRRTFAFGELNIPDQQLRKELLRALTKAQELSKLKCSKNIDKLRSKFAEIMGLSVCFTPRVIKGVENPTWKNSRLPARTIWSISPVWRCAPNGAYVKANRFCSLLHLVVRHGFKTNIVRLLERIAKHIWHMSVKDFSGVCRKIRAKIAHVDKSVNLGSSPDPLLRPKALSNTPVQHGEKRNLVRKSRDLTRGMRVSHAPTQVGVLVTLLNRSAWAEDLKRVKLIKSTWLNPRCGYPQDGLHRRVSDP